MGTPSIDAAGSAQVTRRSAGMASTRVGDGHHHHDADQVHVEHLRLTEHRPEHGVDDLVEGAPAQGDQPGAATRASGPGPGWSLPPRTRSGFPPARTARRAWAGRGRRPDRPRIPSTRPVPGPPAIPATMGRRIMMSGWTPPTLRSSIRVCCTVTNEAPPGRPGPPPRGHPALPVPAVTPRARTASDRHVPEMGQVGERLQRHRLLRGGGRVGR